MSAINTSSCLTTTGAAPATFAMALKYIAGLQCFITAETWYPDPDLVDGATYDFIIVGAGSAGSVLASRLSEVTSWKILLLEAGGDPPCESDVPYFFDDLFQSDYDWKYSTVNTGEGNQGNVGGSVYWPRGKMLGGCSGTNAMIYFRGSTYDYLNWYNAGNKYWHPNTTSTYFKMAESLQDQSLLKNSTISNSYGHHGPLVVNTFNYTYRSVTEKILEAWSEIGVPTKKDLNTVNSMGAGIFRVNAANGVRMSAFKTYVNNKIVSSRSNLDVGKHSFVTKVLIDANNLTAYGVQVNRSGTLMTFYASKEVILSAGSIGSPQLLLLSGIGDTDHLTSKNIRTLVDSPMVGKNLQDHCIVPVTIYVNITDTESEAAKYFDVPKYLYNRTGHLVHPNIPDVSAFYAEKPSAKYPDFQNHLRIYWKNSSLIEKNFASLYVQSIADSIVEQNAEKALIEIMFTNLHPFSRGNILLNTNSPYDHPLIHYNPFSDSRDLAKCAKGIKKITKIVNTTYFKSIDATLGRMKYSACDGHKLDSTDYWKCVCYNMSTVIFHPVGTCKMGTDPSTAVVDGRLIVHGVSGLRVVDASIMPNTTSGNTHGPVVMIAERAADLIKEDYEENDYKLVSTEYLATLSSDT